MHACQLPRRASPRGAAVDEAEPVREQLQRVSAQAQLIQQAGVVHAATSADERLVAVWGSDTAAAAVACKVESGAAGAAESAACLQARRTWPRHAALPAASPRPPPAQACHACHTMPCMPCIACQPCHARQPPPVEVEVVQVGADDAAVDHRAGLQVGRAAVAPRRQQPHVVPLLRHDIHDARPVAASARRGRQAAARLAGIQGARVTAGRRALGRP